MKRIAVLFVALFWIGAASAWAQCRTSRIDELCAGLAEHLVANLQVRMDRTAPIVVAPFANLHDLRTTSPLGRILGEEVGNAFARYGYSVADARAFVPSPHSVKQHGETALSADPNQAGALSRAVHVLTGTYAPADGNVLVSVRIVDTTGHVVLSTASCRLRLTESVNLLLAGTSLPSKAPAQPATLLNLKNKADAKRIQQALAAQGLYKAKIDGLWGRRSKDALARFRASLALPANAVWDQQTQSALLPSS